ncbi:2-oxoacid:acceptor oxidoreductase subunit alpha [Candidatus Gracilibacteria bacterium]|nr:2-oxoacid:acceptor oxidoreductase subunit alpha [Candidatus Gracilibacteria bacterium]
MQRTRIKIIGQSGTGLLTVGEIVSKGLQELGFYFCADREYPSLIKGGHSCYTINFSEDPVYSLSDTADILVAIDKHSLVAYFDTLREGGILVHGYERTAGIADILKKAKERNIIIIALPSRQISFDHGATEQMVNIVLLGMIWKVLGFDFETVQELLASKFEGKKKVLEIAMKCLRTSYDRVPVQTLYATSLPKTKNETILLDGNHAVALGAIHAGMRFYVAYPMSPSSSILSHVAKMASRTGVVVKQAEDEITAVQMALGGMFAGTRAMTSTSGGGYDLMTETVSLAGIIENPLVILLAQRPGPGTGLPTWTAQADLNLAIHSSHGEFARIVVSISEPTDAFETIQHAFNLAEKYQIPVIVLSEKVVCESKLTVSPFKLNSIPIERGLVTGNDLKKLQSEDRYQLTPNGLSKRWIPGSSETYYFANGDEHTEKGTLTEEADPVRDMYEKRVKKLELIKKELPVPEIYGETENADISFVGWGSMRTVMMDVIRIAASKGIKVNYLHYRYVFPLNKKFVQEFAASNKNLHLIEGNYTGQLGEHLEPLMGREFSGKLLKWNGRPFFLEDVLSYIDKHFNK